MARKVGQGPTEVDGPGVPFNVVWSSSSCDRGIEVIGVDPPEASLVVARRKPGAERVRWIHGDATTLPPLAADLATMTGNVAQVFLFDDGFRIGTAGHSGRDPSWRDGRLRGP